MDLILDLFLFIIVIFEIDSQDVNFLDLSYQGYAHRWKFSV